jgi:hypothetical protein
MEWKYDVQTMADAASVRNEGREWHSSGVLGCNSQRKKWWDRKKKSNIKVITVVALFFHKMLNLQLLRAYSVK